MIKMGISGDRGSFSAEAAALYTQQQSLDVTFNYLIDMEGVLSALGKREIELGILPVVNWNGGLVKPALKAMGKYGFVPVDELWFHVNQCLLVLPGTPKQHITCIVSHTQGLAQCTQYLEKEFKSIDRLEWCDTARAAKDLSQGRLESNCAIIASAQAAKNYSLEIMAQGIQNSNPNLTGFIIVQNIQSGQTLSELRKEIDELDSDIIRKLAARQELAKEIGQIKQKQNKEIVDLTREKEQYALYEKLALDYRLKPEFVKTLFDLIIGYGRAVQK